MHETDTAQSDAARTTASNNTPATSYTMGYSKEFLQLLDRRSAGTSAAYLLPHLKPGMKLLDFGCGPGTISVGLAGAVAPGECYGIDVEASQIEIARAAAAAGGHDNMVLQTGDVTDLPFEDDYFDVAHGHAVLMHVPDTHAALAEVKRVLKPGGLLASREFICDSSFIEPERTDLNSSWETFGDLLAANGGHPQMGRQLKGVLLAAGFDDIQAGLAFEKFVSAADVAFFHGFVNGWFFSDATVDAAVKLGLASRERFDGWQAALTEWREESGAIAAIAWGEALVRKP